jgi:hypothetical protein
MTIKTCRKHVLYPLSQLQPELRTIWSLSGNKYLVKPVKHLAHLSLVYVLKSRPTPLKTTSIKEDKAIHPLHVTNPMK